MDVELWSTMFPILKYPFIIPLVSILCFGSVALADERLPVTPFSTNEQGSGIPKGWEPLTFPKIPTQTQYRIVKLNGRTVIEARSRGGASGLVHALDVNPSQLPWLSWRWRIDHVPEGADVTTKAGDDCAARIYITFKFDSRNKGWWERVKHKTAKFFSGHELPGSALVYAWTSNAEVGAIIDSPYTPRSKLIVLRSGNRLKGQWIDEKRNIVEDYRAAFGSSPPHVTGIAIMTDTDNTGRSATAIYGDIRLKRIFTP